MIELSTASNVTQLEPCTWNSDATVEEALVKYPNYLSTNEAGELRLKGDEVETQVTKSQLPLKLAQTFNSPAFRELQANDFVERKLYKTTQPLDFFEKSTRNYLPLVKMRANMETEEITAYKVTTQCDNGDDFYDFCERAAAGRTTEQLVYHWLNEAGVVANLETMTLNGDTSTKAPDITVRCEVPDSDGNYIWYSLEVKTTTLDYETYTDDPSTFPDRIRVDSVKPYDQKRATCTKKKESLLGTLKVHSKTGGVLFIPDSTRDTWEMETQVNKWKTDKVYWASRDCMKTFDELVSMLRGDFF